MSALSDLYKQHAEAIEAIVEADGIPEGYELETARMDTNPRNELEWNKQGVAQPSQFRHYFHRLVPIVKMPEPKPSDLFTITPMSATQIHMPVGLSHRDQLAMNCPYQVLEKIIPRSSLDLLDWINKPHDTYNDYHYVYALVKASYIYADMMIAESKKEQHAD